MFFHLTTFYRILISCIISHGILDFYTMFPELINNFCIYVGGISILMLLMKTMIKDLIILIFITLTFYHFGEDFKFLYGNNNKRLWAGCYILGLTVWCQDGKEVWINTLNYLYISPTLSAPTIEFMNFNLLLSFLPMLFSMREKMLIYLVGYTMICAYLTVIEAMLFYFCTIHVPLAVLRFYFKYGILPVLIWSLTTIFTFFLSFKIPEDDFVVDFGISTIIVHMIAISIWQLKNL